ncbi:MAG TPA: transcription factor S [Nitrososphaeraceae archaeon]|nr:transcription factor S [Nitrososphaeraceae archaeon]
MIAKLKFCPSCESRMKPMAEEGTVKCPKCGYAEQDKFPYQEQVMLHAKQSRTDNFPRSSLKVMDSDAPDTLPTTTIQCTKCGNMTAFWWMLQTRSADEATTQFYRCTSCSYTWRNYS